MDIAELKGKKLRLNSFAGFRRFRLHRWRKSELIFKWKNQPRGSLIFARGA
jgi:hypothetical protein